MAKDRFRSAKDVDNYFREKFSPQGVMQPGGNTKPSLQKILQASRKPQTRKDNQPEETGTIINGQPAGPIEEQQ